jgi:hypothetical protein
MGTFEKGYPGDPWSAASARRQVTKEGRATALRAKLKICAAAAERIKK